MVEFVDMNRSMRAQTRRSEPTPRRSWQMKIS
jgi:hypothetical protein